MINDLHLTKSLAKVFPECQARVLGDFVVQRVRHHLLQRLVHTPLSSTFPDAPTSDMTRPSRMSLHALARDGSDWQEAWRLLPNAVKTELMGRVQGHEEQTTQVLIPRLERALLAAATDVDLQWGDWRRALEDAKLHTKTLFAVLLGAIYSVILGDYILR
jgi:hypothetical protein